MTIAYLLFALVLGVVASLAFKSNGAGNFFWKVAFMVFTLITGILLLGALWPYVSNGQIRLI